MLWALAEKAPQGVHPDLVSFISAKQKVHEAYSGLDDILGTKLAQVGGKTQIAQAKKAVNETKMFKDATSSGTAFDQTTKASKPS